MSQNNLNKSNKNKSLKNSNTINKNGKENKALYDLLRPIVHDYSKLCKNGKNQNPTENKTQKKNETTMKLIFEQPKTQKLNDFIKTNVDKKFRCQICENMFKDPLECYKCFTLFCNECIKKKLEEHKCPNCFNIIFRDMMRSVDIEQMDNYKQARVKCPFIGCKENLRLKEIEEHIGVCIFKEMTEFKMKDINKIIYKNDSDDPLMKTHMLNFLKEINKNSGKINSINKEKAEKPLSLEDLGFHSRLTDLKDQMNTLNEHAAKIMGEMTKITKTTNSNLKNLINN